VPLPIVIDFGIAKATSQQRLTDKTLYTAFERFIGTPAYMSHRRAKNPCGLFRDVKCQRGEATLPGSYDDARRAVVGLRGIAAQKVVIGFYLIFESLNTVEKLNLYVPPVFSGGKRRLSVKRWSFAKTSKLGRWRYSSVDNHWSAGETLTTQVSDPLPGPVARPQRFS
jgi:hypothetical protein